MDIEVKIRITDTEGMKHAIVRGLLEDDKLITISVKELKELMDWQKPTAEVILTPTTSIPPVKRHRRKIDYAKVPRKKKPSPLKFSEIRVCALEGCENILTRDQVKWGGRYCSRSHSAKAKYHPSKPEAETIRRKEVTVVAGEGVRDGAPLA